MEMFDLYNSNGELIGKVVERGSKLETGEFHLVAHIWIRNSEGKYLIQKRAKKTDKIFGQYAATGGAVTSGENSLQGAVREVKEEIGLTISESELKCIKRYYITNSYSSYITDLYLVEKDVDLSSLTIDQNELSECVFMTMDEIRQLVKDNMFWDYENTYVRKGYFDLIEKS